MHALDLEIANRKAKGFALAAVIGSTRVYRGNGVIECSGPDFSEAERKEFNSLVKAIERQKGHIGWQGPKRRLKKPSNPR